MASSGRPTGTASIGSVMSPSRVLVRSAPGTRPTPSSVTRPTGRARRSHRHGHVAAVPA